MKIRAKDPKQVWKEEFESSQTRRKDGLESSTISGVPVKPLYTSDDLPSRAEALLRRAGQRCGCGHGGDHGRTIVAWPRRRIGASPGSS